MSEQRLNRMITDTFLEMAHMLETGEGARKATIAVTALGSEHGEDVVYEAAKAAANRGIFVKVIGSKSLEHPNIEGLKATTDEEGHKILEKLLESGEAQGGVTMHYPFPIGVSTVGRVLTPSAGKQMFIATTTGTSATDRIEGMIRNAVSGIERPTVGILNVDGARQAEIALTKMAQKGYDIAFATSGRSDGGAVMRGNDVLTASCDVLVTDPLTGNILIKMLSAFLTGGSYESVGYGYGPGIGEGFGKLILIASRASGAPVIANAIEYAAELVRGNYAKQYANEMQKVRAAGFDAIVAELGAAKNAGAQEESVQAPPKEVVVEEIAGIEILDLEDAVKVLWKEGIYAESGMGCTGPIILISEHNLEKASGILAQKGYIAL